LDKLAKVPQFFLEFGLYRPDMMQGPTKDEMGLILQHLAYWKTLTQSGTALVIGRTLADCPSGYAIFIADNEEHAAAVAEKDPAVGILFSYVVRPFKVSLLGDPAHFQP